MSLSPDEEARTLRWLIEEERAQARITALAPNADADAALQQHSDRIGKMLVRLRDLAGVE